MRRGFTLIELLVVMVIIGIILAFILTAAMDSVRRAEERATQSLIAKLENGLNDRLDALLQTQPDPNATHESGWHRQFYYVSAVNPMASSRAAAGQRHRRVRLHQERAARRVLRPEQLRSATGDYPLNFAGNPFPVTAIPIRRRAAARHLHRCPWAGNPQSPGEGIYGASYFAAAGIYKNLGYLPAGLRRRRQRRRRLGLVDELAEGVNRHQPRPGRRQPGRPQAQDGPRRDALRPARRGERAAGLGRSAATTSPTRR